jgi:hypothetical protein
MKWQGGQSMVEFASGAAALLLMLLGVITLSGYQETQRRNSSAARQVAYESAWHAPDVGPQQWARNVYRQHFDDAGLLDASGKTYYVQADNIQVSNQRSAAPGLAGEAASLLLAPLEAGRVLSGEAIDLDAGGYVSGELAAHVVTHAWTPEPFRNLDIILRQPYAVLADPWNGGSAAQVRDRTASLVPTQRLASLATAWQAVAVPLSLLEPTIGNLCLGLIEPDTVPEDRLGPRTRAVNAGRLCQ